MPPSIATHFHEIARPKILDPGRIEGNHLHPVHPFASAIGLGAAFLARLGLNRRDKAPDLKGRVICYCYGFRGRAVVHTQRELGIGSSAPCWTDPWGRGKEGEPILRSQ
jgi:hypothetical protein